MKRTLLLLAALLPCVTAWPQNANVGCSIWRRDVKILADLTAQEQRQLLASRPEKTTVHELATEAMTYQGESTTLTTHMKWENIPRQESEDHLVSVRANIVACKEESNDHDYHIVLQDADDPSVTMVVEIPDPTCPEFDHLPLLKKRFQVLRDWFDEHIAKPSDALKEITPVAVTVVGVPFWDARHPGKVSGAAHNFRELHPVTDFIDDGKKVSAGE